MVTINVEKETEDAVDCLMEALFFMKQDDWMQAFTTLTQVRWHSKRMKLLCMEKDARLHTKE